MELLRSNQGYLIIFGDYEPAYESNGQVDDALADIDRDIAARAIGSVMTMAEGNGDYVPETRETQAAFLKGERIWCWTASADDARFYINCIAAFGSSVLNRLPSQDSRAARQATRPIDIASRAQEQADKLHGQLRAMEQGNNI